MAADASDKGDKTQLGSTPPPQLKRPSQTDSKPAPVEAQEPSPDRTHVSAAPPPTPQAAAPPPAAPPDAEEEGTVIITRERVATATLQRVQPPGHSEVIALDRTSYLIGRSHKCDLPLYSSSASREHARLTFRDAAWYVQPLGGKTVIANGVTLRDEQRLAHKMRLQLGGDELLFFDETAGAPAPEERPAAPRAPATARRFPIVALVVAAALALGAVVWWLLSGSRVP